MHFIRYFALICLWVGAVKASTSSTVVDDTFVWNEEMYQKHLVGPFTIGEVTSWHTLTKDVPVKIFTEEELKRAKGMERHFLTSLKVAMNGTKIKWRSYKNPRKNKTLVKAIASVKESEWFTVRDMLINPYKEVFSKHPSSEILIDFHYLAKEFFVLGNTPENYRGQLFGFLRETSRHMQNLLSQNVFDESTIPLWIMGVKFKRDDFPNNASFQRYVENRTPYRFDPGHFWVMMQSIELLFERDAYNGSDPIFKKLLALEQPHFLIKLLSTRLPRELALKGDIDQYLAMLQTTPVELQGPIARWLSGILLRNIDFFKVGEPETRQSNFLWNMWAAMSD